jgi:hypothetical protein
LTGVDYFDRKILNPKAKMENELGARLRLTPLVF